MQHVAARDGNAFIREIDWDAIFESATAGVPAPTQTREGFIRGAKRAASQADRNNLVRELFAAVDRGGSFTFLRVETRNKRKSVLFRVLSKNESFSYHSFMLAKRPDGPVRAVDFYQFGSGEPLSQTLRTMYLPVATNASRGILEKLLGSEQEFMKNFPKVGQMATDLKAGKNQAVLDTFAQLPASVQKHKAILLMRVRAAQGLEEPVYTAALEDFRKHYPNDPAIDLLSVDYYVMKKQYTKSLECVDRLDKAVGGDPYLHVARAGIHMEQGRFDEAEREVRKAIEQEPTLHEAYTTQVALSLRQQSFTRTLETLKILHKRFNLGYGDLTKKPGFAAFVKSPQYGEWQAFQREQAEKEAAKPK
jgi:tetratricopeptide (TPR) repeat protein